MCSFPFIRFVMVYNLYCSPARDQHKLRGELWRYNRPRSWQWEVARLGRAGVEAAEFHKYPVPCLFLVTSILHYSSLSYSSLSPTPCQVVLAILFVYVISVYFTFSSCLRLIFIRQLGGPGKTLLSYNVSCSYGELLLLISYFVSSLYVIFRNPFLHCAVPTRLLSSR